MKSIQKLWQPRLAAAAVVLALPLAALAQGPSGDGPERLPPGFGSPHGLPAPGPFGATPPSAGLPLPPPLRGLDLSEAQQDKLFALLHEQAPRERELRKAATKALENLRRLALAERFDADKARGFATSHGQALGQLALLQAELDSKLRALLSPEQRKQVDEAHEPRGAGEPRGEGRGDAESHRKHP